MNIKQRPRIMYSILNENYCICNAIYNTNQNKFIHLVLQRRHIL